MTFTAILDEARRITKANSTSFPTAEITTSANKALDRAVALIRNAEGRWEFDDSNNTDLPIATTGLVASQQDYGLDSTHYKILRIEVKDENGDWSLLTPIDQADVYDQSITDYLNTAGLPKYYDKIGNSVFLYPKPSYTQDASLKVFYERGASYFTTSDTTKAPGINPMFHNLIPMWCAYDYALINSLPLQKNLREEIAVMEQELKDYYSSRNKDERVSLTIRKKSFR